MTIDGVTWMLPNQASWRPLGWRPKTLDDAFWLQGMGAYRHRQWKPLNCAQLRRALGAHPCLTGPAIVLAAGVGGGVGRAGGVRA